MVASRRPRPPCTHCTGMLGASSPYTLYRHAWCVLPVHIVRACYMRPVHSARKCSMRPAHSARKYSMRHALGALCVLFMAHYASCTRVRYASCTRVHYTSLCTRCVLSFSCVHCAYSPSPLPMYTGRMVRARLSCRPNYACRGKYAGAGSRPHVLLCSLWEVRGGLGAAVRTPFLHP